MRPLAGGGLTLRESRTLSMHITSQYTPQLSRLYPEAHSVSRHFVNLRRAPENGKLGIIPPRPLLLGAHWRRDYTGLSGRATAVDIAIIVYHNS